MLPTDSVQCCSWQLSLALMQIVDVSEEPGQKMKVACSIKLVDQREGTDLDPTNTKYQPRGEGPPGGHGRGPITASAAVAKGILVTCASTDPLRICACCCVGRACLPAAACLP